ncbi:hypothetical protein LUZ60_008099 [Juncus effusus]|nr:hypothetical protein LUZ60_008099 [Juncus effusus]
MENMKSDSTEAIGSVKAAISIFGERINGKKQEKIRSQEEIEDKSRAETELFGARRLARELAQQIEETNTKTNQLYKPNNQITKKPLKITSNNDPSNEEVMRKLEIAKNELRKIQLDINNALEAKEQAERKAEASAFSASSNALRAEELLEKLEQADEEHVIVELARIEAERETREIEKKRELEAEKYKREIESMKEKIKKLQKEMSRAKELEARLETTNTDVIVLQNEMEFVRAMESSSSNKRKDEPDINIAELESAKEELKSKKKELQSIKDEGFQYMSYMDRTRIEIMKIREEAYLLKEREKKADLSLHNLNSKLVKAKSRLESGLAGEERTEIIVTNLKTALDNMPAEIERVKKEKDSICEQTEEIRTENEKIYTEKVSNEAKLQEFVKELKMFKASERVAMKKLKSNVERTINGRFQKMDQRNIFGSITISKLEYDYLIRGADVAKSVADKKVAACRVWIKALQLSEKEIQMRTESMQKEIEVLKATEELHIHETEKDTEEAEREIYESMNACVLPPKDACILPPRRSSISSKRVKVRRVSVSSKNTRSSITIKRKKKMVPNLIKFMRNKNDDGTDVN